MYLDEIHCDPETLSRVQVHTLPLTHALEPCTNIGLASLEFETLLTSSTTKHIILRTQTCPINVAAPLENAHGWHSGPAKLSAC